MTFGFAEAAVFAVGLISGTANTVLSKFQLEARAINSRHEMATFSKRKS